MTHDSNILDTSIEYRVTGPAVFSLAGVGCSGNSVGDVVKLKSGRIDIDGDVMTVEFRFIRASSLTPVTGSDDIRIPRADLPEVEDRGGARLLVAEYTYSRTADPRALRGEAIRRLAVAEYLERRESEAAVAEERRNKRRNELAREFGGFAHFHILPEESPLRRLIEAHITLEEEAAK